MHLQLIAALQPTAATAKDRLQIGFSQQILNNRNGFKETPVPDHDGGHRK
jgi:hypothetical protein